jgi:RimJ/RimL family protein N-acetyltransferase
VRTTDAEFIRRVMTNRRIWRHIADDHSGDPAAFEPPMLDAVYYLAPEQDGRPVGVFVYHPHSVVLYEVHTCVLPQFWGPPAVRAARAGLRWMVDHTPCRKVITFVPAGNKAALHFARRVGMTDEGINRASFLQEGRLIDQTLLGITGDEICLLQP